MINGSKGWNSTILHPGLPGECGDCVCVCIGVSVLYWVMGLAEISFSISPISKFMSTSVGSVITQVEIKVQ